MIHFVWGLILGLVLIPAGVYVCLLSGRAPVSAFDSELPFEDLLTSRALQAKFAKEPPKPAPVQADEGNLTAGARLYVQHCALCHGLPVGPVTKIASGMFPPPPQLFHGPGVTKDPPWETYWKTFYGIRLTGMPAFRNTLSDTEIWQISLLLAHAQKLPTSVARELNRLEVSKTREVEGQLKK